jgi:hypothetical protein
MKTYMNKKYIIFSGCSYAFKGGANAIQLLLNTTEIPSEFELIRLGTNSAGNDFIVQTTMIAVQNLLDKGIEPKDILVLNNFTQIYRPFAKLPKEYYDTANELFDKYSNDTRIFDGLEYKSIGSLIKVNNEIYSFLSTIKYLRGNLRTWFKYQKDFSDFHRVAEEHFESYLYNIILLQTFLKNKNVYGLSFLMNNVFEGWDDNMRHIYTIEGGLKIPSTENQKHISEISDYTKILWDLIDFNMMAFHSTNGNKYGGIDEYFIDKFCDIEYLQDEPTNNFYFGNHPEGPVYYEFFKEHMLDKVINWYKND